MFELKVPTMTVRVSLLDIVVFVVAVPWMTCERMICALRHGLLTDEMALAVWITTSLALAIVVASVLAVCVRSLVSGGEQRSSRRDSTPSSGDCPIVP